MWECLSCHYLVDSTFYYIVMLYRDLSQYPYKHMMTFSMDNDKIAYASATERAHSPGFSHSLKWLLSICEQYSYVVNFYIFFYIFTPFFSISQPCNCLHKYSLSFHFFSFPWKCILEINKIIVSCRLFYFSFLWFFTSLCVFVQGICEPNSSSLLIFNMLKFIQPLMS